jgi:hypothetical protein
MLDIDLVSQFGWSPKSPCRTLRAQINRAGTGWCAAYNFEWHIGCYNDTVYIYQKVSMRAIPCMLQNLLYASGLIRITWYPFARHVEPCGLERV